MKPHLYFCVIFITSLVFLSSNAALLGCKEANIKLLNILTLLCNSTQAALQAQEVCAACFLQATKLEPGPRQLLVLSQCATLHLQGTGYQLCAENLALAIISLKPTLPFFKLTPCTLGYCEFVQCVRRTNAAILVNACFVASMVNRDFTRLLDRLNFYSNTTACILAKARCHSVNPINGEIQQQVDGLRPYGLTNGVGTAGYYNHNALQIAPNGDIKILAFPTSIITGDYFCSSQTTLEQSLYDGITCIVP